MVSRHYILGIHTNGMIGSSCSDVCGFVPLLVWVSLLGTRLVLDSIGIVGSKVGISKSSMDVMTEMCLAGMTGLDDALGSWYGISQSGTLGLVGGLGSVFSVVCIPVIMGIHLGYVLVGTRCIGGIGVNSMYVRGLVALIIVICGLGLSTGFVSLLDRWAINMGSSLVITSSVKGIHQRSVVTNSVLDVKGLLGLTLRSVLSDIGNISSISVMGNRGVMCINGISVRVSSVMGGICNDGKGMNVVGATCGKVGNSDSVMCDRLGSVRTTIGLIGIDSKEVLSMIGSGW